jgi:hypothetical protein
VETFSDGRFVIVWESWGQDGDGGGIVGRILGADGVPSGPEIQVNVTTSANQVEPSLAVLADGSVVVVWTAYGQPGKVPYIAGRLLDSQGQELGPEFQVGSSSFMGSVRPAVAALPGGGFAVVWATCCGFDGSGYSVLVRRFLPNATPQGNATLVNTYKSNDQDDPDVAAVDDGTFMVVWQSYKQDGDGWGVFAQTFAPDGSKVGAEAQVNPYNAMSQWFPCVAAMAGAQFIVGWEGPGADGIDSNAYGQVFAQGGTKSGNQLLLNGYDDQIQQHAIRIAPFVGGGLVAVWNSSPQPGVDDGVFGRRFGSQMEPVGVAFHANVYEWLSQADPDVAAFADGSFVVVWDSPGQDAGGGRGVFAQRFDSGGMKLFR